MSTPASKRAPGRMRGRRAGRQDDYFHIVKLLAAAPADRTYRDSRVEAAPPIAAIRVLCAVCCGRGTDGVRAARPRVTAGSVATACLTGALWKVGSAPGPGEAASAYFTPADDLATTSFVRSNRTCVVDRRVGGGPGIHCRIAEGAWPRLRSGGNILTANVAPSAVEDSAGIR